ncbi:hypothetical protein H7200_00420, partial [Candidatus Saccharibacteria bacterium]|nr:hypothetical protein [Candidatus Saccharibacteria bacterium]
MNLFEKRKNTSLENFTPYGKKGKVAELIITDLVEGDGEVVPDDATITAHYTG